MPQKLTTCLFLFVCLFVVVDVVLGGGE